MVPFLAALFILICILLIAVVLLQKGRGGGLAGAFGGGGGHSAFGARTGDMFTWITVVMVALYLLISVAAVKYFRPEKPVTKQVAIATQPAEENAPAAPQAPETPSSGPAGK